MSATAQMEKSIFLEAVEIEVPAERVAFLDKACAGDPKLRAAVEALLASHQQSQGLLDVTTSSTTQPLATQIGSYKLLQQIGEGGMGTVFMAEQTEPVQRRVALKIIKPGMDSRQVIARFEAERQALAMMDHPNIAKVLDAGTIGGVREQGVGGRGPEAGNVQVSPDSCLLTPGLGRPYFVMELVRGIPITKYCDEKHLTLKQRLELFVPICQAIQHAHQKGIIHRDLKPTNVLIAEYDNQPVPKIIDFGVAKAIAQKLTERTMFTEFGQVVGTLEYMSPEQAKLNQLDIDTRSDVYSLGVLLYELLTGSTPFDRKRLQSAAFDEMLRIIREEEPPKPSTRLSTSETLPSIAANRDVEPTRLCRVLRGELDWIVMKALEKDRNRRYESASGFAKDIEHYLNDEPVQACPPSASYRLRKFARRNKVSLITGGLIGLSLVVGTVVSVWQAVRAVHAGQVAQAKQKLAEESFQKARDAVNEYFTLVSQNKLLNMPGLEPLRRDLLEAALRYYEGLLDRNEDNPAVLADIAATHMRVSTIYHRLDRNDDALAAVGKALPIVERLMRDDAGSHEYQRQLAGVFKFGGANSKTGMPKDPDGARRTLLRALQLWTALAKENPAVEGFQSDIASLQYMLGALTGGIGYITGKATAHAQAAEHLQKAAAILDALSTAHPADRNYLQFAIAAHADLGGNSRRAGNELVAKQAYQRGQELEALFVARFPDDLTLRSRRASQILKGGLGLVPKAPEQAEKQCRQALKEFEALTEAFPNVSEYQTELAGCYRGISEALFYQTGLRVEEGIQCTRKAIEIYEGLLKDFPERRQSFLQTQAHNYRYLAYRLAKIKDFAGARASFEESSEVFRQCAENAEIGERATCFHGRAGNSLESAALWAAEGRSEEAQQASREALQRYELLLPQGLEKHITVGWINGYHSQLAQVLEKCGTPDDALRILHELHPPGPELNSDGLRGVGSCYTQIARILLRAGRNTEGEAALRQAQEAVKEIVRRAEQGGIPAADSPLQAVRFDLEWSGLQEQAGLREESHKSLLHAAELLESRGKAADVDDTLRPEAAKVHSRLGNALKAQGKLDEAIDCYRKAVEFVPTSAPARIRFGQALQVQGKLAEAVATFRKAVELDPQSVEAWQYLGWVEYRTGNSQASIEALEKSCKLQNPGDCGQWIVMSLAHEKLANEKELSEQERDRHKTEAHRWYDMAVKQIDGDPGLTDELGQAIRAFRAEAAELFDVKEKPK